MAVVLLQQSGLSCWRLVSTDWIEVLQQNQSAVIAVLMLLTGLEASRTTALAGSQQMLDAVSSLLAAVAAL